ncbi:hypothetical protein NTGHW29_60022 [Candidatus Nitrotoga sp. HW29]|nr:hypothetical protein NTGHW29_60022 [Candidatus Nitrotoga sp. HW29]
MQVSDMTQIVIQLTPFNICEFREMLRSFTGGIVHEAYSYFVQFDHHNSQRLAF